MASRSLLSGFAAIGGLTCLSLTSLPAMAQTQPGPPISTAPGQPMKQIPNCIPPAVAQANLVGNVPGNTPVTVAFTLPLRNIAQLDTLLTHLYDPNDPLYGLYLTSGQFNAAYAPSQADYNAVAIYARAQGLTITAVHGNRLLLEATGTAQTIQSAFNVHLKNYQLPSGRIFRAPDVNPSVPVTIASRVQGLVGLDTAVVWQPHHHTAKLNPLAFLDPDYIGSGPFGGLSPSDIKTAYNLNGTTLTGSGQTLALFELDGYNKNDIKAYEDFYGLPHVPLVNNLSAGFDGTAGANAGEVTFDIELMAALAPGAKQISVYEAPNTSIGTLTAFNRIAVDNSAKVISASWGVTEVETLYNTSETENLIFKQMAAQGQSLFASAGDHGAYGDLGNNYALGVREPASQPYATGVGGTTLTTDEGTGAYISETTWSASPAQSGNVWDRFYLDPIIPTNPIGGGGGISTRWRIPKYQSQSGVLSQASNASTIWRNVPDVSLNADPNTGYSVYYQGAFMVAGGTSCAVPLWASFTALVNQQRVAGKLPPLGFANPAIYSIGLNPTKYANDFHDISDGGDNLYANYTAVPGYDLVSGWGSFNGVNLLADLATFGTPPPPPPVATQLLSNPGFENGSSNPRPWFTTAGVIDSSSAEPSHGGTWKAWLGGYPTPRQDLLFQQVTLPGNITTATLSFYLHIDTAKTNTATVHDTLAVQVRSNSNTVLGTLGTFSNLDAASGYAQHTFDMSAYKGQTVQVYLVSLEDGKIGTSFVVDDFALNVQ